MSNKIKIALIQMKMSEKSSENLRRAFFWIQKAVRKGSRILCLPELFHLPYIAQSESAGHFRLAEPVPGPLTRELSALARQYGVVLIVPLFEKRAAGLYHNTTVVIDADGTLKGRYRKMHLPDDPLFYEKYYFAPGDLGFSVFETRFARIAAFLCWDQWYPEAARIAALQGAEIVFYPTAIGIQRRESASEERRQRKAWQTVQTAHAVANGFYVAVTNRVGTERRLRFWGHSFVADPRGVVLAEADGRSETVVIASCDRDEISRTREAWPFLRDRRIDAYGPILERFVDAPLAGKS